MAAFSFCFSALTCSCLHGISPHLAMWCPTGRAFASAGLSRGDSSLGPFPHVEVGHRTSVRCPPVPEPTVLSSGPVLAFSAVVVFQAPLASSKLHFPQIGRIMARNSGRQSLLDSAFPLFITHQPPPLWFSLFLSLSLPFPPSTPLPPPTSTVPCPVLLKSKALYGEFITTAAIVQPSLVHLRPGLAQGFNVRLTCVCL